MSGECKASASCFSVSKIQPLSLGSQLPPAARSSACNQQAVAAPAKSELGLRIVLQLQTLFVEASHQRPFLIKGKEPCPEMSIPAA
eukprot:CAMPEP_0181503262 /NCGR_PEP_ID=MMETSP1110-20121109/56829_1 /TAXON_ID=174948 /ORGANISM="Symbiodinium sp., Strain CCMP421" /LENGTH=85 /DNA_ID=CAMNT_0023631965 /DNA_START=22 /DNA_END=276 /DNA_ORIENTATION=-